MTRPVILTRTPARDMSAAELTFMERSPIDPDAARVQHAAYCKRLESAGADIVTLRALDSHPDACFVEDVLIALPELFVLCRPGAAARQEEVASVREWLPDDRPIVEIAAPATLEGGDVLAIGRTLYVGRSTRTNEAGIGALESFVKPHGYQITPVAVIGALHLKTAVTALVEGLVLMNPAWIDPRPFETFRKAYTPAAEPFGGNCLRVGSRIFAPAAHEETIELLTEAGLEIEPISISEFAKAEAGLTCLSVVID